ncbi:serine/threonine-protein kinase PknK [Haliangium ochraceum]|uniref:Serine/threonine protein kinase n=1 Tax=Haliangium ochraceum (strain DSM 14365 / JCM 11303 / SMP-2) TaxID=502025 RepID=D0LX92_HALO1|nr:serine/threonine-protein kinase [Haliangium ochraceum]ACY16134.1 serine/threonine protein kinase [Haliangium ochraceum DSM 14365]
MRAGDTIDRRFEVTEEVAAGGMGRIFRATDLQTGEPVAVKVLGNSDARAAERFLHEARVLAEIRHPGIVRYVAHGMLDVGAPYLVMEWLGGENLAAYLRRVYGSELGDRTLDDTVPPSLNAPRLPVTEALTVGRRLASAVAELHKRKLVHCDITPNNLVLADGTIDHVKLIDFGTVRHRVHEPGTSGDLIGTPFYMAPEQARSEGKLGPATDVWAIGCVLYECLTGYKAFWADNIIVVLTHILMDDPLPVRKLRPELPEALASIVMRSLSKAASERPPDAEALAQLLEHLERNRGDTDTIPRVAAWPDGSAPVKMAQQPTLTRVERRVSCLLFARHVAPGPKPSREQLAAVVAPLGAELERLADGSLLVSVPGSRTPSDQATHAARAALALREAAPGLAMSLTTGRVEGPRQMPPIRVLTRAARVLQRLPASAIRLDEATASLLDARFHLSAVAEGADLRAERPYEAPRTLLGRRTRWVGRQRELSTLLATFHECVEDEIARAVLVTAVAGMGKSRLCYEFERAVEDTEIDFLMLRGRGDAVAAGSPFVLLAPALRRLFDIRSAAEPAEQQAQLIARLAEVMPLPAAQHRVAPLLGELMDVPFPVESSDALRAARADPILQGQLMQSAWLEWLTAECARQPVILLIEDLHWGDLPSVNYIDAALRSLSDAPLLVLALSRPEVHTAFPTLWSQRALSEIPLHPLSRRASQALVREALGERVSDEVVRAVVRRAGGNAFYLEELIRAVADGNQLGEAELPDTIVGMVQSRLDALGSDAKRVLRAASVFGEVFWKTGVETLLGDDGVYGVDEWLSDLVAGEVLVGRPASRLVGEEEYAFSHALMRDGAYAMLTAEDRELGHRLAGDWLERSGERDNLVLAEHFARGGEPERAIPHYLRAAAQALESGDLEAAVQRAEQAAGAGASGRELGALRSLQSVASYWLSDYVTSQRHGREAVALLAEGGAEWFAAMGSAIVSSARLGEHDDELSARAVRATAAPGAEAAQIVCLCRVSFQLVFAGRMSEAYQILARIDALLAAADAGAGRVSGPGRGESIGVGAGIDAITAAHVYHLRSFHAAQGGYPDVFLPNLEAAVAAFERAGDIRNVELERSTIAWAWSEIGFFDHAAELARKNLAACIASGNQQAATYAKLNLGQILGYIGGNEDEARRLIAEAAEESRAVSNPRSEGWANALVATLDYRAGDPLASERHAARAVELLRASPGLRVWGQALHARALVALGRAAEALPKAEEAMEHLRRFGGLLQGNALPPLVLASALDATGQPDAAREALNLALERLAERAARLSDPDWRARYVALPDHAATRALAERWGLATSALDELLRDA